jgi:hypothetical protein
LKQVSEKAAQITAQINSDIEGLERVERWKRLALIPIWLFFIAMALLFWFKWRMLARKRTS